MRILLVGASGFVGGHLAPRLVEAGHDLVCAVRASSDYTPPEGAERIELDLDRPLDPATLPSADAVLHFAQANVRFPEGARELDRVNAASVVELLDHARESGATRFVYASSASVYGLADEFPTTERHHHHNNDTLYGAAKSFNEGLVRSFRAMRGLDYVGLAYFNVYGPRMDVHGAYTEVLVRWMERIADGEPPLIFGDGRQTMDFVCVPDIARANILAAASGVVEGRYNIASGGETSLLELAEALLRAMGSDLGVEHGPERAVNGVTRRLADIGAARRDLGWAPTIGLEDGLRMLVEWWRPLREEIAAGRLVTSR